MSPKAKWTAVLQVFAIIVISGWSQLHALGQSKTNVTLAWNASPESNIAGYRLYYGGTPRTYTNTVDVPGRTSGTVSNLAQGATYYFALTAYSASGLESDPSQELNYQVPNNLGTGNRAPVLTAISNQLAYVRLPLTVTNFATDPNAPTNRLTYSLKTGAPKGARINATNGLFTWTPKQNQAPSTNLITVEVADDGTPSLSDTKSFTVVVGDYIEVSLGSAVVRAGDTGTVTIGITATAPLTNVSLLLEWPEAALTNFALPTPTPPLSGANLQYAAPDQLRLILEPQGGLTLQGNQVVSRLNFRATPGQASGFVPLRVTAVSAYRSTGTPLVRTLSGDGRVVVVGNEPLLEMAKAGPDGSLILYAPPGLSCTLQSSPSAVGSASWTPMWTGGVSNLMQVFTLPTPGTSGFFRVSAN